MRDTSGHGYVMKEAWDMVTWQAILLSASSFVLKGARQLPVTAIAEYTFYKLNEYFLKHSDEIDKLIADSEKPPNEIYPKKVAEWLEFQRDKSAI